MRIGQLVETFKQPIPAETEKLLADRWNELPEDLQKPWQVVGRHHVHCGYTMGPAYCSFGCTHCYLPANANKAPMPSLAAMKQQIDANRGLLGPGGNLQITGGDVVDAYFRVGRPDELIEVLRYANDAGVVPMLMTHGQRLLENPEYLDRLVTEGGLRKIALHIDITQAGRPGFPIKTLNSEVDLHPLRQQFVDLVLASQQRTGVNFFCAHTVTVTERNLDSIANIVSWLLADSDRLKVFRMISLQPEADVGRTRFSASPVTPESTWEQVCHAAGRDLPRHSLWYGDPKCSSLVSLMVPPAGRAFALHGEDDASRRFWQDILEYFGGVGGRGEDFALSVWRKVAIVLRHPSILPKAGVYIARRLWRERLGPRFLWHLATGKVAGLNIVMHNFMSEEEVAAGGEDVERRLASCSFRGAIRDGDTWQAVPMCSMNATQREALYATEISAAS